MAIPIFLIIDIYIRPIKLLEIDFFNVKYNLKKKLCKEYIGIDWGNNSEIKEVMAVNNNQNNDKEDF